MRVTRISAVTLFVKDMASSCKFYSAIPGFMPVCGGKSSSFATLEIKKGSRTYLNLELRKEASSKDFGRIIFYTSDVDKLHCIDRLCSLC